MASSLENVKLPTKMQNEGLDQDHIIIRQIEVVGPLINAGWYEERRERVKRMRKMMRLTRGWCSTNRGCRRNTSFVIMSSLSGFIRVYSVSAPPALRQWPPASLATVYETKRAVRAGFCVGDRFYLHENRILCEYDYEERMIFANMPYFGGAAGAGAGMPGPPGGPPPPGLNHHHGAGGVAAGSAAGLGGQPKRLPGPPVPGPPMAGQGGPGGPTPLPNGTTHHITADGADPLSGHPVPHSSTHSGPYGNPPQGSESMLEAK
ncbi:hypothetical protein HPB48_013708 [Haemaphysalis longicornis]|uniref:Uncharacterized protein n=1 Tax=Haemaphysalis longicornis TaxID=44386 RepID=A0A9J6GH85_HAELO|nr:hypothetical protein HPB48_013708 [Haemaphysalis longicornis]